MENPRKNLPIALIGSTILVTVFYILLQIVFLRHASLEHLNGQVEVASISIDNIFGETGMLWVSIFIAIQLVATISSYIWIGSRISYAMASEHKLWQYIAVKSDSGIPVRAIWLQALISILLTSTGSFEQVMLYCGFVLQLMGTLTITSIFFIKPKKEAFRSPGGRVLQVIYVIFSIWMLIYLLYERPFESVLGLGLLVVGTITYLINQRITKKP